MGVTELTLAWGADMVYMGGRCQVRGVQVHRLDPSPSLYLTYKRAGRPLEQLAGSDGAIGHVRCRERVMEQRTCVHVTAGLVDQPLGGEVVHVREQHVLDKLLGRVKRAELL